MFIGCLTVHRSREIAESRSWSSDHLRLMGRLPRTSAMVGGGSVAAPRMKNEMSRAGRWDMSFWATRKISMLLSSRDVTDIMVQISN